MVSLRTSVRLEHLFECRRGGLELRFEPFPLVSMSAR